MNFDGINPRISIRAIDDDNTPDPADLANMICDDNNMPVLPLRGMVPVPQIMYPISVGRESSLKLCEEAYANNEAIFLVAQKDPAVDDPTSSDLYRVGVVCRVLKVLSMPDGTTTCFMQGGIPAKLKKVKSHKPYMRAVVEPRHESVPSPKDKEMAALLYSISEVFDKILESVPEAVAKEMRFQLQQFQNPLKELNFIMANSPLDVEDKQALLEISSLKQRAFELLAKLNQAEQLMALKANIQSRTQEEITQQQREHFLHQQIRSIQDELGESDMDEDIQELEERAEKKKMPEYAVKHFEKELKRLERYAPQSPDYAIQYTYIDTLLSLPWEEYSPDNFSLSKVEKILNNDHYGLDKVKERIIEQMAVIKLRNDMKAPILCLYGPPGVGKTSLGKSIASALGREYRRISLGGVHDESEIRGHRRTYLGAMPGRIISALKNCGTSNPVIVLDEVDKIGQDFKGDPSTALLEVLDPEQNSKFHDNYIDVDYDLSKVLFIATANSLSTISQPLLDRMELIPISGYTTEEKVQIAIRHLIPKEIKEHGMVEYDITFEKDAIAKIINFYTRESGVRQLEKKIAKILRKIARTIVGGKFSGSVVVKKDDLKEYLGPEEVTPDMYENNDFVGVVTGLAWTSVGGEILFIESSLAPGKGEKLTLTGNLGDVMKESAVIALQYLKAHAEELGIDREKLNTSDVHIHVPEGAIPKDGPSAGITMVTSLASAFTGRKVKEKLAMTGEITLRGKVLPVGGIKEKILAAKRAGIVEIILCSQNRKDIEEIDKKYLKGLKFHYVDRIDEVLKLALI